MDVETTSLFVQALAGGQTEERPREKKGGGTDRQVERDVRHVVARCPRAEHRRTPSAAREKAPDVMQALLRRLERREVPDPL